MLLARRRAAALIWTLAACREPTAPDPSAEPRAPATPVVTADPTAARTPTTAAPTTAARTPTAAAARYDVVLVAQNDVLNVRAAPDPSAASVATLPPDARGVVATGRVHAVGAARWVEVRAPGGVGWINARYVAPSVDAETFAADPRPRALLGPLAAALKARGDLTAFTGPRGLVVDDYGTPRRYAPEQLAGLLRSAERTRWSGPACGEDCREGTFAEIIGAPLAAVLTSPRRTLAVDRVLAGGNASARAPDTWANLHHVSVMDPGTEAAGHLDWRAFTLYFDQVDGAPRLFGIVPDAWSP